MAYQALARKYRPQTFADVIGQEALVRTLQNAIEQKRIHHAFLFAGVRGVGKTTSARILAKALNCIHGPTIEPDNSCSICQEITEGIDLDVREIDAATYTGVDNVRELRDVSQFQPARDRYRIFIIDEAHMLSTGAWNALLKILEEPPPHVVFMFATTEINKVPQTILSRVQKFLLRKITLDELIGRLEQICREEKIEADRSALELVARRGEGSVRDALSLLDQIIAFSGRRVTRDDVFTILGLADVAFFARVMSLIREGDHAGILTALQEATETGRDFKLLYRDLLAFARNLLLTAGGAPSTMLSLSDEDGELVESCASNFSYSELLRITNLLLKDDEIVSRSEHQRLAVEVALLKAATFPRLKSAEELLATRGGEKETARQSSPSREEPKRSAVAPRMERREVAAPAPTSAHAASIDAFISAVSKKRKMIGTYLSGASERHQQGDRLLFTFEDAFWAESVAEAKRDLEVIATEVFGTPMTLDIRSTAPAAAAEAPRQESAFHDDPVLQAFSRHLGGEIVERKKR